MSVISSPAVKVCQVHVRYKSSPVRLSVCRHVRAPYYSGRQAIEIFGNFSTPFGTVVIH